MWKLQFVFQGSQKRHVRVAISQKGLLNFFRYAHQIEAFFTPVHTQVSLFMGTPWVDNSENYPSVGTQVLRDGRVIVISSSRHSFAHTLWDKMPWLVEGSWQKSFSLRQPSGSMRRSRGGHFCQEPESGMAFWHYNPGIQISGQALWLTPIVLKKFSLRPMLPSDDSEKFSWEIWVKS